MSSFLLFRFWQLATDSLTPQESASLAEDLGIELDTPEHEAIERGPLCAPAPRVNGAAKRKREG